MKITIEEKQKEIEMLEREAEHAETEEQILARENREREARAKRVAELQIERKKVVFEFFKDLSGKEMTEEQYAEYIQIYENPKTRRGYSILDFINGDKGAEKCEKN